MLEDSTFKDSRVIKLAEQFVPVKIDTDKHKSVAKRYRIHALPTILFADGKGRTVAKIRGYRPPEEFAREMEKVARLHRELPQLEAKFAAEPADLATGGMLAAVYAFRGEVSRAKKSIKIVEQSDPNNEQGHLTEAYMAVGEHYDAKEEYGKAGKFYVKAVETGQGAQVVAEARFSAAEAHFRDQARFEPGHRAAAKRLKAAEEQLTVLLAMADLPEDQKHQATELLQAVQEGRAENQKRQAEKRAERRKKSGRGR